MGKLTEYDDQGNWSLKGVKWKDLYVGMPITREVQEKLYGALWKLMEYERIGLDPGQVEQILEEGRSRMYRNHEGYPAPTEGKQSGGHHIFRTTYGSRSGSPGSC